VRVVVYPDAVETGVLASRDEVGHLRDGQPHRHAEIYLHRGQVLKTNT
jgi:hypothetical protein